MFTFLRALSFAITTVLTLFASLAIGEEGTEVDTLLTLLKANPAKLEEVLAAASLLKVLHAKRACRDFRTAIGDFEIYGITSNAKARSRVNSVFGSAFAAIDAAKGDSSRTAAKLAFDLAKGLEKGRNNPWYFEAGFRVIYANVCN